jgi:uncharacterized protein (DUF697 family)
MKMRKENQEIARPESEIVKKMTEVLERAIGHVPSTKETAADDPEARAREIIYRARIRSALVSGTLAIPPGPLGMLTVIPDLLIIWEIQAHMVANIAGAFGKKAFLNQEQMIHCLFKHFASQLTRDIVTRVGERILVRRASLKVVQQLLEKIGVRVSQRVAGRAISRWIPVAGTIGVAAYAQYDTNQVGQTAIEFFSCEIKNVETV